MERHDSSLVDVGLCFAMNWFHLLGKTRAASEMNLCRVMMLLNEIRFLFGFCTSFMFTRCYSEWPIFVVGSTREIKIVDISYGANHGNLVSGGFCVSMLIFPVVLSFVVLSNVSNLNMQVNYQSIEWPKGHQGANQLTLPEGSRLYYRNTA